MDECKSFKKEYDKCFNTWFRDKFLKGSDDDSMCSELLKNYTGCVKVLKLKWLYLYTIYKNKLYIAYD